MHVPDDAGRHRAHVPTGTRIFLNARSLNTAHRRLARWLRPGLTVLDVGCGTGAITRGMAEAVAPNGRVVGIDMNPCLIQEACLAHSDVAGLSFAVCDVYSLPFHETFDIVSTSRVLQWLAHPVEALRAMTAAAKPGGRVIVLDYNHEKILWKPDPPPSMLAFYSTFLRWRAEVGMDNAIADHLPTMFANAGLVNIVTIPQPEISQRSNADFATRLGLWADVAASRGHQMVADGVITEGQRAAAEADYRRWIRDHAESQSLYLVAVEGVRPF